MEEIQGKPSARPVLSSGRKIQRICYFCWVLMMDRFGEISAGIVCSTLPIFPRIVRHIREKATKKSTVSLPRNLYTYPAEVAKMRKPLESWQGTYDSHMMTRKYHGLVELDEISRLNTVQSYSEAGLSRAITLEDEISYRESSQAENSQIVVIPK